MALVKTVVVDKIEVLEQGQIQVRQAVRITENGELISQNFHRIVLTPGSADIEDQDQKVKNIAAAIWTDDVLQAWSTR